jgi:hypothetical protein
MVHRYAEPAFDLLVALATGLAAVSYLLGLFLPPRPALLVGGLLVGVGTVRLVPHGARLLAGTVGLAAVLVGGGLVPIVLVRATRPGLVPELVALTVGVVLLATFAVLHLTTFRPASRPAA